MLGRVLGGGAVRDGEGWGGGGGRGPQDSSGVEGILESWPIANLGRRGEDHWALLISDFPILINVIMIHALRWGARMLFYIEQLCQMRIS